jgi:hypothetical protein
MNYGEQIINNIGFVVAMNGGEPRPSLSFHLGVAEEAPSARDISPRRISAPRIETREAKSIPSVETGLIRETLLSILVSVLTTFWLQEMAWDSRLKPGTSSSRISVG